MAIYDVSGCRAEIIRPKTTLAKWVASQPVKPFAVINASLYDMKTYEPCGTVIENGAVVHNEGDGCGFGYKGNDIYFGTALERKYTGFLTGYNSPVWGKKYVAPSWTDTYVFGSKNTRIGIGSKNGKPCIVTADGVTLKGFADYALQQGCDYLVNLDGGGSRFLYYNGKTIHSSSRTPYNAIVFYKLEDENKEPVKAEVSVVKCPYKEPTALVKLWSIGEGAKWTQWYLNQHGYDLKVDGLFYNASVTALKDFQSKHGLDVDGKSGPLTRAQLKILPRATTGSAPTAQAPSADPVKKALDFAYSHLGDLYTYGAQGEDAGDKIIDWSARMYPANTTANRAARMKKYVKAVKTNPTTGAPLKAYDCSGFVLECLKAAGFSYADTTAAGIYYSLATPIKKSELQPGDLVFESKLNHIGIVGYNGEILAAEGSDVGVVKTPSVNDRVVTSIYGPAYGTSAKYQKAAWTKFARPKAFQQ